MLMHMHIHMHMHTGLMSDLLDGGGANDHAAVIPPITRPGDRKLQRPQPVTLRQGCVLGGGRQSDWRSVARLEAIAAATITTTATT